MKKLAFKMKLNPGMEQEYTKGHGEIWPELSKLLMTSGISDYSIFLDKETHLLFSVLLSSDETAFDKLPNNPLMKKWWDYMKDIMETNPDNSPLSVSLQKVFHME